jgi:long-chain acyl-CoA synthetase
VIGLPGQQGPEVHAVLLCEVVPDDPGALIRQANAVLAPHQRIAGFSLWPEPDFPRTHTLKIKRRDVLERVRHRTEIDAPQHPSPISSDSPGSPLTRLILEASGDTAAALTSHDTLAELGLDSLARVELLAIIETELGVYLDESMVDATTSVGTLQQMVESGQNSERPKFSTWPRGRVAQAVRTVLQRAAFALLGTFAPTTASGTENLDCIDGPVLFVANHTSHLDSAVLLSALPARHRRRVAVAAAADYFFARPLLGSLVALLLNAFPFSRTTAIRPTLEHCAALLDSRWSIMLYPEGTRSMTGTIGEFKAGVGLLAVETPAQLA